MIMNAFDSISFFLQPCSKKNLLLPVAEAAAKTEAAAAVKAATAGRLGVWT